MEMGKRHYNYIDALKGLAILAVFVDHICDFAYTRREIRTMSYFSVSLFVLVAGVNSFLSMYRRGIEGYDVSYVKKRCRTIFIPYLIATAFCTWVNFGYHFYFVEYIKAIILFSSCSTFYYVFFYLQLIIVSPVLFILIKKILTKGKNEAILSVTAIICIGIIAYFCTEYTSMLNLVGGGKFLLGGSYLIVYFIGMLIGTLLIRKPDMASAHILCGGGGIKERQFA